MLKKITGIKFKGRPIIVDDLTQTRFSKHATKTFCIQKLIRYAPDLETKAAEISVLAGEVWREHYTPIIGSEQVEYMLAKLQSAKQICTDIQKKAMSTSLLKIQITES
ncbi:MAG: hypothetical protein FWH04_03910 [Oscillospiraceae bacterium]|nr:hypothetical protein [Oscillospiraceae bacterium]